MQRPTCAEPRGWIMPVVILTQPVLRVGALRAALVDAAFEVQHWPMSEAHAEPATDWHEVARGIADSRWTLFPSPASIDVVMAALEARQIGWPASCGIGVIGPGSREALQRWESRSPGLLDVQCIEPAQAPFDADALLARAELQDLKGIGVTVLRRSDGREAWLQTLRERGARLTVVTVYRVHAIEPPDHARSWAASRADQDTRVVISIASADAGRRLFESIRGWPKSDWLWAQTVLTQHPRIADELRRQGWTHVEEHAPGIKALLHRLESLRKPS